MSRKEIFSVTTIVVDVLWLFGIAPRQAAFVASLYWLIYIAGEKRDD